MSNCILLLLFLFCQTPVILFAKSYMLISLFVKGTMKQMPRQQNEFWKF